MLVQLRRQKPGGDIEIFVVVSCQPAGVLLRFLQRTARGGRVLSDLQFVGTQH
jgi:hypothetical protein